MKLFQPKRGVMPSEQKSVRTLRVGCLTLQGLIGAVCVLYLCPVAVAQEVGWPPITLSETGKANHELGLRPHGHLDASKCVAMEPPVIDLEIPPSHGVLCVRPVEWELQITYTVETIRCIGHKVWGIRVVYLPRHAYAGDVDTLRYVVRYKDKLGPMTVNYNLTIVPDAPSLFGALPADIGSPADNKPQSPGPIPACTPLVS
jgi:hypothetical protein